MLKNKKVGLFLIFFGFSIMLIYFISFKSNKIVNSFLAYNYYNSVSTATYYGVIEIPKLDLVNIIYNKKDPNNNVNKNIFLVKDDDNLIVLAAHSGSSPISYFKNLYLIKRDDVVVFNKNGRKKQYEVFKKEVTTKDGEVSIKKFPYPLIVLITCSKSNNKMQELYYARLILNTKIV